MSKYRIPVYKPSLLGNERKYVLDCLDSTWISGKGVYLSGFEDKFAAYINSPYATAVCNGTVALHLALRALGIGPGDQVIVPTLTYVASANTIVHAGAKPVFADSLCETWQIDPADVLRKIRPETKAIMVVHLYGHPCDMDPILQIAREHRLFVIEDCAEAVGTKYKGQHVGTFGDISTFSFFGNKTITTGEGGMVVTNDATLFDRAVHFKGQGLASHREYWHDVVGYNYRMTNLSAAVGLAQLEQVGDFLRKKRRVANGYKERLAGLPIEIQPEASYATHSYWMVSALMLSESDRDKCRELLAHGGVETRPVFYPIHTMPMYAERYQRHPIAESIGRRGVTFPSWPDLTDSELDNICDIVRCYFK